MNRTRYCSTCGTLLSEGAAICGECGARYQASPYERRATDAPGAWSQAPKARSRDLGSQDEQQAGEGGVELISPESLRPREPGATALRTSEQYDQMMVTQPPTNQPGSPPATGPAGPGSPAPAAAPGGPAGASAAGHEMEPPLDGCAPGSPLKRLLAALIDGVIATLVLIPIIIGLVLFVVQNGGTLALILVGVGAALPAAYTLLIIWLQGAKGITIGKLILGLRTTRYSAGGPIGFLRALGRAVLYALVPPVMALSIFLDPRGHLRGFHDRAIDSAVVDVKQGRNPFHKRPDDFERHGPEHYLGEPSVAVSAHENLLSTPGAAWAGDDGAGWDPQGSYAPSAPQQPGPDASAPSPYAPPPSAPEAPQAAPAGEQPPIAGSPWSSPPAPGPGPDPAGHPGSPQPAGSAPEPAPGPPPPEQGWGPPGGWGPPEQQSWQPPAQPAPEQQAPQQPPAPQGPADPPARSWDASPAVGPDPAAPSPAYGAAAPAPYDAPEQAWGPAEDAGHPPPDQPGPGAATAGQDEAPPELTADAWDDGGDEEVDEQTRIVGADVSDLGDLEQTRVSAVAMPPLRRVHITADGGAERTVDKAVVIGRNPSAPGDEVLFVLPDDTRSVSKTHLHLDGTGDEVTVTDLGSTNGSAVVRADGSRENLVPNTATVLPAGASVAIGDRTLTVEREQ